MDNISKIEVFISDQCVGRLALTPQGLCAFEYDPKWLQTGFSISPFQLPLESGLKIAKRDPFFGGFGVFDDSLPDGWGNLILDRYLLEQGINPRNLTILDRLALIGSTGRGALEYRPDRSISTGSEFKDFDRIAREAEAILSDKNEPVSIDDLYRYGGSSGGARPKIFTKIDNQNWLVKFKSSSDPINVGEIEHHCALLAKECDIVMSETKLFNEKYFGTIRFDRSETGKIHTISAAGLLQANYRIPSLDYFALLQLTQVLTRDIEQVLQMFRRMVFNILIANRDDHAKNFSFQYLNGKWMLSPAYDLLPSDGFNGNHTTTINGKGEPTRTDVLELAKKIGIATSQANAIIDELIQKCSAKNLCNYRI